jgi:hypothetical protein
MKCHGKQAGIVADSPEGPRGAAHSADKHWVIRRDSLWDGSRRKHVQCFRGLKISRRASVYLGKMSTKRIILIIL